MEMNYCKAQSESMKIPVGFERLPMLQRRVRSVCPGAQVHIASMPRSRLRRRWQLRPGAGQPGEYALAIRADACAKQWETQSTLGFAADKIRVSSALCKCSESAPPGAAG